MTANPTAPATHVLDYEAVRAWLAEYGIDAAEVKDCTINIGRVTEDAWGPAYICAWLDVEWYRRGPHGGRYFPNSGEDVAVTARSAVPLHSWPPMRAAT